MITNGEKHKAIWKVTFQKDNKWQEPHEYRVFGDTIYQALAEAAASPYGHRIVAIELED